MMKSVGYRLSGLVQSKSRLKKDVNDGSKFGPCSPLTTGNLENFDDQNSSSNRSFHSTAYDLSSPSDLSFYSASSASVTGIEDSPRASIVRSSLRDEINKTRQESNLHPLSEEDYLKEEETTRKITKNHEYTVQLTSSKLQWKHNLLHRKRSKEYRAVVALLDDYHRIRLSTGRKDRLKNVLGELINACERYIEKKDANSDTRNAVEKLLSETRKAFDSITLPPDLKKSHVSEVTTIQLTSSKLQSKHNLLHRKRSKEYRSIVALLDDYHQIRLNTGDKNKIKKVVSELKKACEQYIVKKDTNSETRETVEKLLKEAGQVYNSLSGAVDPNELAVSRINSNILNKEPTLTLANLGIEKVPEALNKNLEELDLSNNFLSDLPEIGELEHLKNLRVCTNVAKIGSERISRAVATMKEGATLDLRGSNIRMPQEITSELQPNGVRVLVDKSVGFLGNGGIHGGMEQTIEGDYSTVKQCLKNRFMNNSVEIAKTNNNCFIRCFAEYVGKKGLLKPGETAETVTNEVSKLLRDSGLRPGADLIEGNLHLDQPNNPVAMAVKKYFDKKYNLDLAYNIIEQHPLVGTQNNIFGEQCSDRKARDIVFMHFTAEEIHYELFDPKHSMFAGFNSRMVDEEYDYTKRREESEASWRAYAESDTGSSFKAKMMDFDQRLNALLSNPPETLLEAETNLPWFLLDGSLGAGSVDVRSEMVTADHLFQVVSKLRISGFSQGLCNEVRDHLQKKLKITAERSEQKCTELGQEDHWEFLIRNGTSFYSKHEKATVRITFQFDKLQREELPPGDSNQKESRTRYCDTRSGSMTSRSQETKSHLGTSVMAPFSLPNNMVAAVGGSVDLNVYRNETLEDKNHHHIQSDCKPIPSKLEVFSGNANMIISVDGPKPRREHVTMPNKLRLQLPKGACEKPAQEYQQFKVCVSNPSGMHAVAYSVHSFPIQRLVDGLRMHLEKHGLSAKEAENLLEKARSDFFNEKNFTARNQYLFTGSLVSQCFKEKMGFSTQFETFFEVDAELSAVQQVGVSLNDGAEMCVIKEDIGEGVESQQAQRFEDGKSISFGASLATKSELPDHQTFKIEAGPSLTLFGTTKEYGQHLSSRSLAKAMVTRADSLHRYKAEVNVTVKINSNTKRKIPPFQCQIPIELVIPESHYNNFESKVLNNENAAQTNNPARISFLPHEREASNAKAIQNSFHFGYAMQIPGAEKIFHTIRQTLHADSSFNKLDIQQQSNIVKSLQVEYAVPAIRAKHQSLLQGCPLIYQFSVGSNQYRIELVAEYSLPDDYYKETNMSAYRFNRGTSITGNSENKSQYSKISLGAGARFSLPPQKGASVSFSGALRLTGALSRGQEHSVTSGFREHRCLKTSNDILRFDCPTIYTLTINCQDPRGKPITSKPARILGTTSIHVPTEFYPKFEQEDALKNRATALQTSNEKEFLARQGKLQLSEQGIDSTHVAIYGVAELASVISRMVENNNENSSHRLNTKFSYAISKMVNPEYLQSKIESLIGPSGVAIPLDFVSGCQRTITLRMKPCSPVNMGAVDSLGLENYTESYSRFSCKEEKKKSGSLQIGVVGISVGRYRAKDDSDITKMSQTTRTGGHAKSRQSHLGIDGDIEIGESKEKSHTNTLGSMNLTMAIQKGPAQKIYADALYEISLHELAPEARIMFNGCLPPSQEESTEYCKIKHGLELIMPNQLAAKYHLLKPSDHVPNSDQSVLLSRECSYIQPEIALHCSHIEHLDAERILPKITQLLQKKMFESHVHPEIAAGNGPTVQKRILDESFSPLALRANFGQLRSTGVSKQIYYPKRNTQKVVTIRVTASLGNPEYQGARDLGISAGAKSFQERKNAKAQTTSLSGAIDVHASTSSAVVGYYGFDIQGGIEHANKIGNQSQNTFRNYRRLDTSKAEEFIHPVEYRIELWDGDVESEATGLLRKMNPFSSVPDQKEPFATATVPGSLRVVVPAALTKPGPSARQPEQMAEQMAEQMVKGRFLHESVKSGYSGKNFDRQPILSKSLHALNFPGALKVARWAAAVFSSAPPSSMHDSSGQVPSLPPRFEPNKIDGATLNQAFSADNLRGNIELLLNHQYEIHLQGNSNGGDKLTVGLEITKARWLAQEQTKGRYQNRHIQEPESNTEHIRRRFHTVNIEGGLFFDGGINWNAVGGKLKEFDLVEAKNSIDKDLSEKVSEYKQVYEFGEMDVCFHVYGSNGQYVQVDVPCGMTGAIMSEKAEILSQQFPEVFSRSSLSTVLSSHDMAVFPV